MSFCFPDSLRLEFALNTCLCSFIPYCSSDVWSGTRTAPVPPQRPRQARERDREASGNLSKNLCHLLCRFYLAGCFQEILFVLLFSAEYAFMGSLIIHEVIKDLAPKGMKTAKVVMLSGSRCVVFTAWSSDADHGLEMSACSNVY